MKTLTLLALLHTTTLLTACSEKNKTSTENTEKESNAPSCLLAYKEKLAGLLSLETASKIAEKPKEQVQQKYSRAMKNPSYHSLQYVWESNRKRTMKILGRAQEVPVSDVVELHGLKEVALDYFKKSHRRPSDEQLAASKREIGKAIDGKSENAKVNAKLDKLDELKVSKETQKSTAGELNSVFAEVANSYSEVTGVGQAAAWNSFENRLYVFENGIELSVTVDVSNDGAINKRKAVSLSRRLLSCK